MAAAELTAEREVQMSDAAMSHSPAGSSGHSSATDWKAGALAGLLAGAVFLVLEMAMVPLFLGGSPWAPPRMMGAIVLGQGVLPPPATFALGVVAAALIVHFFLSAVYGLTVAPVLSRMGTGAALAVGLVFGLLLYAVNFYGFTAVFPWFANARNWVTIFSHGVFGLLAALFYLKMKRA